MMNRRNLIIGVLVAIAVVALFFAARDSKEKKVPFEMVNVEGRNQENIHYGLIDICNRIDSVCVKFDDGATKVYDFSNLIQSGGLLGVLRKGDRITIEMGEGDNVIYAANVSMIAGRWVEPSPVDEGSDQGIELEESGAANSINLRTIIYRTWYLHKNKLYLYYVTEGRENSTDAEHDVYDVMLLTRDSLVLRGRDVKLVYTRQKSVSSTVDEDMSDFKNDDTQDYNILVDGM